MSLQHLIRTAVRLTTNDHLESRFIAELITHTGEIELVYPKHNEAVRDFKRRAVKMVQMAKHKQVRFKKIYLDNDFDGVGIS